MAHEMCECGHRPATYHEVVKINGEVHERHLCEQCAAERGLAPPTGKSEVQEVLEQLTGVSGPSEPEPAPSRPKAKPRGCPTCKLTFQEFKKSGLLGCPDCYEAMGKQLAPLIERAHQGATCHVGKLPKRAMASGDGEDGSLDRVLGDARERAERIRLLKEQLDAAIKGEHFERAAQLRDEVKRLVTGGPGDDDGGVTA